MNIQNIFAHIAKRIQCDSGTGVRIPADHENTISKLERHYFELNKLKKSILLESPSIERTLH